MIQQITKVLIIFFKINKYVNYVVNNLEFNEDHTIYRVGKKKTPKSYIYILLVFLVSNEIQMSKTNEIRECEKIGKPTKDSRAKQFILNQYRSNMSKSSSRPRANKRELCLLQLEPGGRVDLFQSQNKLIGLLLKRGAFYRVVEVGNS